PFTACTLPGTIATTFAVADVSFGSVSLVCTRSSGASMPGATDTTASGSTTTFFVGAWSESGGVSRGCGCTLLKPSFPDCEPAPRPKKPDILAVIWPKYDWPLLAVSALVLTTAVRSSIE